MTRALVWKEVREQWAVWLALALVATAATAGLMSLFSPGANRDEMLVGTLWLTAWGYGLVCGALLLAGETEAETQPFLDSLPGTRPRIWRVKAATGLAFLAALLIALMAIGFVLFRERYAHSRVVVEMAGMLASGVIGYAWGLYCGSFARNVLGAIARAVALQAAWATAVYLVVTVAMMLYVKTIDQNLQSTVIPAVMGLVAAGVAVRSRSIYCQPDRLRAVARRSPGGGRPRANRGELFREAFWEAGWLALGAALYGLAGMAALPFLGVASWPPLTLLLGVVCGVTVRGGERGGDSASDACGRGQFDGSRWLARAVVRFGIAVAGAGITTLIVVVPNVLRFETAEQAISSFFKEIVEVSACSALSTNPSLFLAFWLVAGYASGLLSGFLSTRRLPAAACGLALACLFGGVWLPSVYTNGDLHSWHAWVVPAVFAAAAVLLAFGRAAGGLPAGPAAVVAGGAVLTAGLATAAALGYRAYEMPPVADAIDEEAFRASLPGPKENVGGRLTSEGLLALAAFETRFSNSTIPLGPPPLPGTQRVTPQAFFFYRTECDRVTERGWKAGDPRLGDFLDLVFAADDWATKLADAADKPTGTLLEPVGKQSPLVAVEFRAAENAATLLTARGLQLQDAGQPQAFLDHLSTGLALARTERHLSSSFAVVRSTNVEAKLARGVERWLERLDGRPDLLRRALATLQQHLDAPRLDPEVGRQAEFLTLVNVFADPVDVPRIGRGSDPFFPVLAINDSTLLRYCWQAPWEKVRLRRVLEGMHSADPKVRKLAESLAPPVVKSTDFLFNSLNRRFRFDVQPRDLYPLRAAVLQVALRLYQHEVGRPAGKLDELVPKYLPSVPLDPYNSKPFHYRLSQGETLDWPPDDSQIGTQTVDREVPAGQGILWCVGEDKSDDGGRVQEGAHRSARGWKEDRISLVPLPPAKP